MAKAAKAAKVVEGRRQRNSGGKTRAMQGEAIGRGAAIGEVAAVAVVAVGRTGQRSQAKTDADMVLVGMDVDGARGPTASKSTGSRLRRPHRA